MSGLANDFAHALVWFYPFVYSKFVLFLSKFVLFLSKFIEVFLHRLRIGMALIVYLQKIE